MFLLGLLGNQFSVSVVSGEVQLFVLNFRLNAWRFLLGFWPRIPTEAALRIEETSIHLKYEDPIRV